MGNLPKDWLDRAANPLKYEGIVAYKVTRVYADGVEDTMVYPEADYLIVDTRQTGRRQRNLALIHRETVAADNEAQKERWRKEQEAYDRRLNHPG